MSAAIILLALAVAGVAACSGTDPPVETPPARSPDAPATARTATAGASDPDAGVGSEAAGATPEETAARMTARARAGDRDGYMRLVAADDAHFAMEQRNWAKDLIPHRPAELAFELGTVAYGGDDATAPMTTTWRMAANLPARTVEWPARFVRRPTRDGPRWLYAGEAWTTTSADGVVVRHGPQRDAAARAVVELLPAIRRRVHAHMGFAPGDALVARAQEVKLYASMTHLQASIDLSYTAALSGWNEPGEAIKVLVDGAHVPTELAGALAHEYAHVATFELGPLATDMPWWLLEGVAELVGLDASGSTAAQIAASRGALDAKLRARARAGTLVELARLADFHGEAQQHLTEVYLEGHGVAVFVTRRHGSAALRAWLEKVSRGVALDAATREALGTSFDELERSWRASLGAPAH